MAFGLQNSTIEEQRCVIRFLTAESEKPAAILWWMVTVYGEKCVSDKSVRKWSARFRAGRESVCDDQRSGQANTVIKSDLIDKVDDLVAISEGVCRLGSKQLTDQQKELRMGLALQHLFRYQEDPAFTKRIVTGDETWCHHYEPETKRDSMQWKHASSPHPKKLRVVKSAGKSLTNGTGQVQMGDIGPSTLQSGHAALQSGHAALRFPCVCPLKKHLKGKLFNSDDVLKDTVKDWVSSQPHEFWEQKKKESCGFVHQWNRCAQAYGVYFEKKSTFVPNVFVEWAQNEIAVVPDFHKRILFSDEAHFWLKGYVNKQNCRIWSEANPQVYVETPLHPEKLTVWCALWAGGILLQKR
ncbi:HTH_48 domain-containing protein [Trichonephila clavipes]|nr:HTH_48 domain-containing protein [Trichonephila clavipes]